MQPNVLISALNVKVMEIHTTLDDIMGSLTKLKDTDPADCHHSSLDAAKKQDIVKQDIVIGTILTNRRQGEAVKEEVVSLTATIVTKIRQGEAEEKEEVATETESNEALSEWEEGRIVDF